MNIADAFALIDAPKKPSRERFRTNVFSCGVRDDAELRRISALPRRTHDGTIDLTEELKTPEGTMSLRPAQSAALYDARENNGLLAPIACGAGKSLIALLLPTILDSKCAVLLVEPQLVLQVLEVDLPKYLPHWRIYRDRLHVLSYSTLSIVRGAGELERLAPDLIVADEAHNLRCPESVRTRRFLRYFKENPDCRFCALSGTFASKSITQYAHLAFLALRRGSPLPLTKPVLAEWAAALDAVDSPAPPGALIKLCRPGESVRSGFRRRLIQTPGVVATRASSVNMSLRAVARYPEVPVVVREALRDLRASWQRPDGEELEDAMRLGVIARQMAAGFYYVWRWPGQPDEQWLEARREWHSELREFLRYRARPGLDSPLLVARAASAGEVSFGHWKKWEEVKERWRIKIDLNPRMPTETDPGIIAIQTVWLDDFLVKDAARWGQENVGIIWYEHRCLGAAIAKAGGFPHYGPGDVGTKGILAECHVAPARTIVVSRKAHGTGKNLVSWSNQLVTSMPGDGGVMEQLLGRTHRPGQEADAVCVNVYRHTREERDAWHSAELKARFIEETKGTRQKLNFIEKVFRDPPAV